MTLRPLAVVVVVAVAACHPAPTPVEGEGDVGEGEGDAGEGEGDVGEGEGEGEGDIACDGGFPAGGSHVVFVALDGFTIDPAADGVDAPGASTLVSAPVTIAPWHADAANRAVDVATIVCGLAQVLAPFDIAVTTTRPASGPFDTVVLGGTASDLSLPEGVFASTGNDCGDVRENDLGWIADAAPADGSSVNVAAGLVGLFIGLDAAGPDADPGDCLCNFGGGCFSNATALCTYGTATPHPAGCAAAGVQDEAAAMTTAFGPR